LKSVKGSNLFKMQILNELENQRFSKPYGPSEQFHEPNPYRSEWDCEWDLKGVLRI